MNRTTMFLVVLLAFAAIANTTQTSSSLKLHTDISSLLKGGYTVKQVLDLLLDLRITERKDKLTVEETCETEISNLDSQISSYTNLYNENVATCETIEKKIIEQSTLKETYELNIREATTKIQHNLVSLQEKEEQRCASNLRFLQMLA